MLAPETWDLDTEIAHKMRNQSALHGCPLGVGVHVLSGGGMGSHSSSYWSWYWLPKMAAAGKRAVQSYTVCVTTKGPCQPPAGKRMLLKIPLQVVVPHPCHVPAGVVGLH